METDLMHQLVRLMLPCTDELQLETVTVNVQEQQVTLEVTAQQPRPACPCCHTRSHRIHSRYRRTLADLPWAEINVCLHLQARKCFCTNPACKQRIFSERLPALVAPWARRTRRLAEQQRSIGLALGGAPSQRLSHHLDCPASRDTFLRLVRTTPTVETPTPRHIGVDDWARRKGQSYGSIVVDLERSTVIDVLPDRSAETFALWLQEHPGVEVISRDRGGSYADGAAMGAPNAVQVTDRWHLLKNLSDALTSLFDEHHSAIEQHLRASTDQTSTPASEQKVVAERLPTLSMPPSGPASLSRRQQEQQQCRRERRLARYERVCQLRAQGWTLSAIADEVGLDRTTVRKYVRAAAFPEHRPCRPRASKLDPFKAHLLQRWNAGCHTGAVLLREIKSQGYQGGASTCLAYITHLRRASGLPSKKRSGASLQLGTAPPPRLPSPRGLAWFVLRRAETLDETDQQLLSRLCDVHPDSTTAVRLAHEFARMVRERRPEQLDLWLECTEQSRIAALVSFAKGIRRDYAAVKASLTLEFSNGPTEGHINRLKMVKRQMFGRAKLDLLKMRLLAA